MTTTKPLPVENGDASIDIPWGTHRLVGIIDGIGHGPLAHAAVSPRRERPPNEVDLTATRPAMRIFLDAIKSFPPAKTPRQPSGR